MGELNGIVLALFWAVISVRVDFCLSKKAAYCGAPPRTE